jgi:quercetin dioxygenase-like cupin family protein
MTDSEFRKVAVDDLPDAPNPTRRKKEVDEAVGATEFGFNVYVADPGQQLPWGEHRHPSHEELLYVVAGEIRAETPGDDYAVGLGEAFFVPPGAQQRAVAVGEGPARVIAVGAPKVDDGAIIEEQCPECDAELTRMGAGPATR